MIQEYFLIMKSKNFSLRLSNRKLLQIYQVSNNCVQTHYQNFPLQNPYILYQQIVLEKTFILLVILANRPDFISKENFIMKYLNLAN